MAYRCGDCYQMDLMPRSIEDYVGSDNPVRAYDIFVEALNFHELGIEINPAKVGNSEYEPRSMFKLLACEIEVIKNLKLLANIGMERNTNSISDKHPAFALGGISYDVSEKFALDAGVKYGLTSMETDWTVLTGLTMRF